MKPPLALLFAVLLATLAARPGVAATVQNANDPAAIGEPAAANIQYILFNRAPGQGMNQRFPETLGRENFAEVLARFPNRPSARVQTGLSYVFSPLRTPPETTLAALQIFLATAAATATPVLVQIDLENWWEARPDLWNWWDPGRPGYDPANRENVEWTGWSPDHAIKIALRCAGESLRVPGLELLPARRRSATGLRRAAQPGAIRRALLGGDRMALAGNQGYRCVAPRPGQHAFRPALPLRLHLQLGKNP